MQKNIWSQIDEAFKKRDDEKVAELQTQYQKLNEVIAALSKMHGFRAIT